MTEIEKAAIIAEVLEALEGPVVLAADFNSVYTGAEIDAAIGNMEDKVSKDGSIAMTGLLELSGLPETEMQAATKGYVDENGSSHACSAGILFMFTGPIANKPMGSLVCDGSSYDVASYPELHAAIGDNWNTTAGAASPGAGKFRVPKIGAGYYPRGLGSDSDLGDFVGNSNKSHNHGMSHTHSISHTHSVPSHTHTGATSYPYGTDFETDYQTSMANGRFDAVNGSWSTYRFTGDGSSSSGQAGLGVRSYGRTQIGINSKAAFNTGGASTSTSGGSSAGSTGSEGSDAKPNSVGVWYCIWDGKM